MEFKFVQIKGQVLLKGEIITKNKEMSVVIKEYISPVPLGKF
jgi:hypothetical protein